MHILFNSAKFSAGQLRLPAYNVWVTMALPMALIVWDIFGD